MRVDQFIKRLKKWPPQYQVVDVDGRHVTGVHLDSCTCAKDVTKQKRKVWLRFKE